MSDKPSVVEALAAVMAEVQAVRKTSRNPEQGYNFRGIDAVVNAVGPVLREHGVVVLPMLEKASYRDVLTSKGKPSRESTVEVRYRFYGPAGDSIDAVVPGEAMDFGDKGVAKAMSVAYRIALLQALCIPTDDADPDEKTYERATGRMDEWEAAPVPTGEQAAMYERLSRDLAVAQTEAAITEMGGRVVAARTAGTITANQYDQLARRASARLANLKQEATSEPAADPASAGVAAADPSPSQSGSGQPEAAAGRRSAR